MLSLKFEALCHSYLLLPSWSWNSWIVWRPAISEKPNVSAFTTRSRATVSTIFIKQTCFTLYQTVYWFNKLFIDLKGWACFSSQPLSLSLSLSLVLAFSLLVSALHFLSFTFFKSYLWWQTKHLKCEHSGHLCRWQSTLAFPLYADIGPLCN